MKPFQYAKATNSQSAVAEVSADAGARFLAGGTNLLDLLKYNVIQADRVVDLKRLDLKEIRRHEGGLRLGAMARNADTANHPEVRQNFPLLSQAILAGASAQIRNMASNGGNLLQRTRCPYFYDTGLPCNKRTNGSGCGARHGANRMSALFGWSDKCVAAHPSDMCVALAALEAQVHTDQRTIAFEDFHRLPGDNPTQDTNLKHGELIEWIFLPQNNFAKHSSYLKVRDRASYAFALVSVAAALELDGKVIKDVRLALGGVAHKPWRARKAEALLRGQQATEANFLAAAAAELGDAKPLEHNAFKVPMARNAIVVALQSALSGEHPLEGLS
jgi:xanthine dehydrogenase YagS FAD-binding subunit